jgi:hypothetical protein
VVDRRRPTATARRSGSSCGGDGADATGRLVRVG